MFERKDTYEIPEGMRELEEERWPGFGYRGSCELHPECYISPKSQIVGEVKLGYHAIVMHGAVLRADSAPIVIGAESNVQENCVLHEGRGFPLTIGEHSTVGHGAVLHGCTVGDNALVGMGAVVLDGAKVGNNALVAAGALVPMGMEVPEGYMAVGVPAKLRGPMTPEDIAKNITSYSEVNLIEAKSMLAEGLLVHPNEDVLREIGAL